MTATLSEAKSRLDDLIAQLRSGEELVLTDADGKPVARIVATFGTRRVNEFPELRHYSAAPVCLAASGVCWSVFGLVGWEPLLGLAVGLTASVLGVSVVFALAHGEGE